MFEILKLVSFFHFYFILIHLIMLDTPSTYSKKIAQFWRNAFKNVNNTRFNVKKCKLPLARIKRLMKVEEDVKMVAAEVPALFSFVTEIFVQELSFRAWMCTEDGIRKILQTSDIGFAIKTSSMYDFLTYIVPSSSYNNKEEQLANNHTFLEKYPFENSLFPDPRHETELQNYYHFDNLHENEE